MFKLSLTYLAIIIQLVVLLPIGFLAYNGISTRVSELQERENKETIKNTAAAFDTFVQQHYDLAILFAEEISSVRSLNDLTLTEVIEEIEQALADIEFRSSITNIQLLSEIQKHHDAKIEELQKSYLTHIQQTKTPIQTIDCYNECKLTVVIPIGIENTTFGLLVSSDFVNVLLAFSELINLDLALLIESKNDSSSRQWQGFNVPVLTNSDISEKVLDDTNSSFKALINTGYYSSNNDTVKYVWGYDYQQYDESRFKLLFIEDQTNPQQQKESQFQLAIGSLFTLFLVIFVSTVLLTTPPLRRLRRLGYAVSLLGGQQYDRVLKILGQIKKSRFFIDEVSVVQEAVLKSVTDLQTYEKELAETNTHLEFIAHHDHVTGQLNRYAFSTDIAALASTPNVPLTLILLDIQDFNDFNDNLGEEVGDKVLQVIGDRLVRFTDSSIKVYRYGGDQFVFSIQKTRSETFLADFAEQILDKCEQEIFFDDFNLNVRVKMGIASTESLQSNAELLQRYAGIALLQAKKDKAVSHKIFYDSMAEESKLLFTIKSDFEYSLNSNELFVCYQPMLAYESEKLTKMEALIRWTHPTLGPVFPDKFIPVLEETGQIAILTDWVIERAIEKIGELNALGLTEVKVSVNISGQQATDLDYINRIIEIVKRNNLGPERLELEITETSVVSDFMLAKCWVDKARDAGFGVAMDDFGTGYSSLSYLTSINFDTVKIDRSLITDVVNNKVQQNVVQSVITMIKSLGKKIVVEGVEEYNQFLLLKAFGCDTAQGYLISKPLDDKALKEALESYLTRQRWFEN